MTGTSMDGIDISLVQTNGLDLRRLNKNYFYEYSISKKKYLMDILKKDINVNLKRKQYLDEFITNEHYLALKDLGIAVDLGEKVNAPLDLGKASVNTYQSSIDEGRSNQDWTSVFLNLQNRAGLSLPENIKE